MKKTGIAAVAVFALAAPQPGKSGGKDGSQGGFSAELAQKLNLTGAQKEQIRAINDQTRKRNARFFESLRQTQQELRAAKAANNTARAEALQRKLESQRTQMKQIRDAERQRVVAVLTRAQRTQFERLEAERAVRQQGKRGNRQ